MTSYHFCVFCYQKCITKSHPHSRAGELSTFRGGVWWICKPVFKTSTLVYVSSSPSCAVHNCTWQSWLKMERSRTRCRRWEKPELPGEILNREQGSMWNSGTQWPRASSQAHLVWFSALPLSNFCLSFPCSPHFIEIQLIIIWHLKFQAF